MSRNTEDEPRQYEAPRLICITSEQGKLICIPYAWDGHKGARELLEIIFSADVKPKQYKENASRGNARISLV
jgi:hypothetical protein